MLERIAKSFNSVAYLTYCGIRSQGLAKDLEVEKALYHFAEVSLIQKEEIEFSNQAHLLSNLTFTMTPGPSLSKQQEYLNKMENNRSLSSSLVVYSLLLDY